MTWNVYYYNINTRKIEQYNILQGYFIDYIKKIKKKYKNDRDKFDEELRRELQYRYWCKSEFEIIISAWCGGNGDEAVKIDIYSQIMMNWHIFTNYCWENT